MAEESHLIFDIPQDEIVVSSSLTRMGRVRAGGGSSRAPLEHFGALGRVDDSVQEEPFVRIAADQPDPADEQQRNAHRADRAGPNSEFGSAVGGSSVRAISFLLIAVACLLLIGSMILTDVTNKEAKGAAAAAEVEFENSTEVADAESRVGGRADATASPNASPDDVEGNRRLQLPGADHNLFKARRPAARNPRGPRKSLHRLLKGSKCTSKQCVEQGTKLVDELEPKIRPCDDFYQHACVRWQHRQPTNVQSDRLSVDYALVDLFSELLVNVIRSDATPFPELKFFIDECVRPQPNLFRNVRDAILRHLDLKGWPYEMDNTIPDQTLSTKVGRVFSEVGLETLFSVYRGPTGTVIGQPRNLLLRHFLGSEPQIAGRLLGKAYEALIQTMAKKTAAPFEEPTMTNVTAVEILLRRMLNANRAVLDAGRLKNCSTRQMIDLPRLGIVSMHRFLEAAVGADSAMSETTSIHLSDTDYFDRMRTLALTKHDLLNYVIYRVILELTPLISNWTLRSTLASVAYSRYAEFSERLDPAQMCVRFLERYEPVVPLYLSFKRALELLGGPSVIRSVLDVLKNTFLADLQNSTMFTNAFKQHATSQVKDIYWEALMPYWLSEQKAAESYADGLYTNNPRHPAPHFFYFWMRTSAQRKRDFLFGNKTSWTGGFLNAWATLDPPYDHLEIPLPVFDFMMPNDSSITHLHLPRVGPRVYRELQRFLWHEAINFDLKRSASEESHYFDRLRHCLENQYRDIDFNPSRVPFNSAKTSASDLLDLLAVRTAFHAYLRQLGAHDGDYRLAGAPNLSGQQLFFLYYARSHCERLNPRFAVKLMTNGPVSPGWYRVNGPLRNMPDFAIAFGCPPGTSMNPVDKCL
ncbi:membrane metallo-endopeptidase-like 1 [Dermacentor variabilis]|uniref:membrane metallo-endopeptidase-like 1 n=1 Tax=Dermacentor variabilis TaxID=34621 RepID=UPI003F5B5D85